MPMMTCDRAKLLLSEYLEGTIEPGVKKEIDEFLQSNDECNKVFKEAMAIHAGLKELPAVKTSDDFEAKLRNKIIAFNNGNIKQPLFTKKGFSVAFSGTVLIIAMYFYIFTDLDVPTNTQEVIMPSSTIISSQTSNTESLADDDNTTDALTEDSEADSLTNTPEKVDNSRIHLTGKQD